MDTESQNFYSKYGKSNLLIAGTGTKSGKTSMACRIIRQFPELKITAIKITPHFHETTTGLLVIVRKSMDLPFMKRLTADRLQGYIQDAAAGAS